MIANWTREDVELLTRARLIWHGRADWHGIERNWSGSEWQLVIQNEEGQQSIISRDDVASGAARIARVHSKPLYLTLGLPSVSMEDTMQGIRNIVRVNHLADAECYRVQ